MKNHIGCLIALLSILILSACGVQKEETAMTEPTMITEAASSTESSETPETPETAETPETTLQTLWDSFGLHKIPERALAQAMDIPEIVIAKGEKWIHRENLDSFYEKSLRGEAAEVLVLHYYDHVGIRMGVAYFTETDEEGPTAYLTRLRFDGEQYTYQVRRSDSLEREAGDEGSFLYLLYEEGFEPYAQNPLCYEVYALTNQNPCKWQQLEWSMLSSSTEDHIPHYLVAYRFYADPASLPEGSYIPDEQEKNFWHRLKGKEEHSSFFAGANLDSDTAREIFQPENNRAQSLLSYWSGERILWKKELENYLADAVPTSQGILLYCNGTLEHYDTQGNLLWQYQETGESPYRQLLSAGEWEDKLVCVFRRNQQGSAMVEIWTLDGQGRREIPLTGLSLLKATCVTEDQVIIAMQDMQGSGEASFYLIRQESDELIQVLELGAGTVPEGKVMTVQDVLERDGFLYISAYYCTEYEQNGSFSSPRNEVQDVIDWCHEQLMTAQSTESMEALLAKLPEQITPKVQEKYTAVLFQTPLMREEDSQPAPIKLLQSRAGSLGGPLYVNENGEIAWEIAEIGEVTFSPATSSFTLYAPCRVLQFFYDPGEEEWAAISGEEPGGYVILEKTVMYYR